ncbi:MAG: thermonuclease family protein [Planctomycetota bacterium]
MWCHLDFPMGIIGASATAFSRPLVSTFLAAAIGCSVAGAGEVVGQAEVIDGDTIEIGETTIRLHGIDAPEYGQKCNTSGSRAWQCGKAAKEELIVLTNGNVRCEGDELDDYGRLIAVCWIGDAEINRAMVESGHAWAFVKYSKDYIDAEAIARSSKAGVWQAETQTPWEFRAERWQVAEQEAPEGCPIKGNISRSGRIYHPPWSPWYSRTKIDTSKGERWFCDEAEALDAGWRPPRW